MANEMTIRNFYNSANLGAAGWSEHFVRDGQNIVLVTAVNGDSFTSLDVTDPDNIIELQQIVDNVNLEGSEYVQVIDNYAYVTCFYANRILVIDITDLEDMQIVSNLLNGPGEDGYFTGIAGAAIVDNIGGYDRVMFVCARLNQHVTAVDISDPLDISVISSFESAEFLDGVVTCVYKDGYLFCAVRDVDCLTVMDVTDPENMTRVTSLFDPVLGRLNDLGGLNTIDGDYLYAPGGTANTFNVIDVSDPTAPFITGFITDDAVLDRPLVAAIVRSDLSFHYVAVTCYDDDRIVLINVTDPTTPTMVQNITDPILNGTDDVRWDPSTKSAYVSCGNSKNLVIGEIPLLETLMATLSKTWTAAVELAVTNAFGGSVADLAADQAYDYTDDVDLETNGYEGAQVLVEIRLTYGDRARKDPQTPDDVLVDVFASLDGSLYDTIPYKSEIVKSRRDTRTQRFTMVIEDLTHFRIGLKTNGTNDTFDYRITYQTWLIDNS